jgi:hypothetical protein
MKAIITGVFKACGQYSVAGLKKERHFHCGDASLF